MWHLLKEAIHKERHPPSSGCLPFPDLPPDGKKMARPLEPITRGRAALYLSSLILVSS